MGAKVYVDCMCINIYMYIYRYVPIHLWSRFCTFDPTVKPSKALNVFIIADFYPERSTLSKFDYHFAEPPRKRTSLDNFLDEKLVPSTPYHDLTR